MWRYFGLLVYFRFWHRLRVWYLVKPGFSFYKNLTQSKISIPTQFHWNSSVMNVTFDLIPLTPVPTCDNLLWTVWMRAVIYGIWIKRGPLLKAIISIFTFVMTPPMIAKTPCELVVVFWPHGIDKSEQGWHRKLNRFFFVTDDKKKTWRAACLEVSSQTWMKYSIYHYTFGFWTLLTDNAEYFKKFIFF